MSEQIKQCTKCKEFKALSEFRVDKSKKAARSGLKSWCRSCEFDYNRSDSRKASTQKYVRSEKGKENAKRYYQRAAQDGRAKKTVTKHHAMHPEAIRARRKINDAVHAKRIPPAKDLHCEKCHKQAEEYHHPDYSKPLFVVPLCKRCHEETHHFANS